MKIKEAKSILYPLNGDKEEPTIPQFEVGKFYVVEFECKKCILVSDTRVVFQGAEFAAKEYSTSWIWSRQLLIDAVPALGWEIRDLCEKMSIINDSADMYFEKFGTANE